VLKVFLLVAAAVTAISNWQLQYCIIGGIDYIIVTPDVRVSCMPRNSSTLKKSLCQKKKKILNKCYRESVVMM